MRLQRCPFFRCRARHMCTRGTPLPPALLLVTLAFVCRRFLDPAQLGGMSPCFAGSVTWVRRQLWYVALAMDLPLFVPVHLLFSHRVWTHFSRSLYPIPPPASDVEWRGAGGVAMWEDEWDIGGFRSCTRTVTNCFDLMVFPPSAQVASRVYWSCFCLWFCSIGVVG